MDTSIKVLLVVLLLSGFCFSQRLDFPKDIKRELSDTTHVEAWVIQDYTKENIHWKFMYGINEIEVFGIDYNNKIIVNPKYRRYEKFFRVYYEEYICQQLGFITT